MPIASNYVFMAILLLAIVTLSVIFVILLISWKSKDDRVIKSCVSIGTLFLSPSGTGFICQVFKDTFIVTCEHVVRESPFLIIRDVEGRPIRAEKILLPKDGRDVAFIKFSKPEFKLYPLLPHTSVSSIAPFEEVVSYGDSLGEKVIVKGEGKLLGFGPDFIEIDAPIVHGNSGGPILLKGTELVIGIANKGKVPKEDAINKTYNKGTRFETEMRRFAIRFDNLKPEDMTEADWGRIDEKDAQTLNKLADEERLNGNIELCNKIIDYNVNVLHDPSTLNNKYKLLFENLFVKDNYKAKSESELSQIYKNIIYDADDLNVPAAKLNLGLLLLHGVLFDSDPQYGFQLIEQAADLGDADAMTTLGNYYRTGFDSFIPKDPQESNILNSTEADYEKAAEWYNKAYIKGNVKAAYGLGLLYYNGQGVNKDLNKAKELFLYAWENGRLEEAANILQQF